MKIYPNAPAFPSEGGYRETPDGPWIPHTGLTIRAEIAARVMAGLAGAEPNRDFYYLAQDAVGMADALIAALNKEAV